MTTVPRRLRMTGSAIRGVPEGEAREPEVARDVQGT